MDKFFNNQPIGVFDSGIGGISVLRSLKACLPYENFIYLGDTARVPYGTKSQTTVINYALQAAKTLMRHEIKLLVIACNTVSALALTAIKDTFDLPVIGVIEPGARQACALSRSQHIALIATEATVNSGCYEAEIRRISPAARVSVQSCGLLVSLAEEGFIQHPATQDILRHYLEPLFTVLQPPDCLILGCTHFPFLLQPIEAVVNRRLHIVNSADATAQAVQRWLDGERLRNTSNVPGSTSYLVTDPSPRFIRLAGEFLGQALHENQVEYVDIVDLK